MYMKHALFLFIMLQGCGDPKPQIPCNFIQNAQHQRISWSHLDLPISVYIDPSSPPGYEPAMVSAMNRWNGVRHFFTLAMTPATAYINVYLPTSGMKPNENGYTHILYSGRTIYHADVYIRPPDTIIVDLESLFVHELGHTLGLDHNTNPSSVMQPILAPGTIRTTIGNVDINSLECEY